MSAQNIKQLSIECFHFNEIQKGILENCKKDKIPSLAGIEDELQSLRNQISGLEGERGDLQKALAKASNDSLHDQLTNLPNRRLFIDRFNQAIESGLRGDSYLALLYFDIDGFKAINDQYGHLIGDKFLVMVAERIQKSIRRADTLARIGGDEFVALFTNLNSDKDEACKKVSFIANTIFHNVSSPVAIGLVGDTKKINPICSLSIGANIFLASIQDKKIYLEKVMKIADEAMFCAKSFGGNQIQIN